MSHSITLGEAVAMTRRFRENRETVLVPDQQQKDLLPLSETFSKDAIQALLNKPDCTNLRIYYGMDEELKLHTIIVASDGNNNDILPTESDDEATEDDSIVDRGLRCPPQCPEPSPLNPS